MLLNTPTLSVLCVLCGSFSFQVGCERGCGWAWLGEHGLGPNGGDPVSIVPSGIDCPDGLARCVHGGVEASRLATVARTCRGPETPCSCPWEPLAFCARGCVVDGLELVMERSHAEAQLCLPEQEGDSPVAGNPLSAVTVSCEEDQLYRCSDGQITDCNAHAIVASCRRGCVAEGASIDAVPQVTPQVAVRREAAYAILCSR